MKSCILFSIFIFSISLTLAQNLPKNIAKLSDKEKVEKLLELSNQLQYEDLKKAIDYAEIALQIAQKQEYKKDQADAYLKLSELSWEKLQYAQSDEYTLKALSIYKTLQDSSGISHCYQQLGVIYTSLANYTKALEYHFEALRIEEKSENQRNIINTLVNISRVYFYLDDYKKVIEYDQKILEKSKEIQDSLLIGKAYASLAVNYLEMEIYEKSLPHYLKAITYLQPQKTKKYIFLLSQTALAYDYLGKYQKGREYHQLALKLLEGDTQSTSFLELHLDLGESFYIQEIYDKALQHYQIGVETAEKQGNEAFMYDFYERIANTYSQIGEYQKAFQFHQKFMQVKDSVYNQQNAYLITEMQTIYETEEKEKQITLEQQKNQLQKAELDKERSQKLLLVIGIFFALIFVGYLFYNNYQRLQKNKLLAAQKKEIECQNDKLITLDAFKQQMTSMIAHDLKNPLNAIIGLSQTQNYSENNLKTIHHSGQQMLILISNMLDIHKFEEAELKLSLEKIGLQQIVQEAQQEVSFLTQEKSLKIHEEFQTDYLLYVDKDLLKRVFINLLNNAIKYSPNHTNIYVKVEELANQKIKVIVQDEGIGISKENQANIFEKFSQLEARKSGFAHATGLGLTFCKMVVVAHKGQIGVYSEKNQGTSFWFTLDFETIHQKIKQTPEQKIKKDAETVLQQLDYDEKYFLKPYLLSLKEIELFEVSKVIDILEEIRKKDSSSIKKWADKVENALYIHNKEDYQDLITMDE